MDVNFENLIEKLKAFMVQYDGKEITINDLRNNFDYQELATILANKSFENKYDHIVSHFENLVDNNIKLFTEEEAEELYTFYSNNRYVISCLNYKKILTKINSEDYNQIYYVIQYLKNDEERIDAFKIVKDPHLKALCIRNLDSDELRSKYLKHISNSEQYLVISSFKDEKIIDKYMNYFTRNKGKIIKNYTSDSQKIADFHKYYWVMSEQDREDIMCSLTSSELIMSCINECSDKIKAALIKYNRSLTSEEKTVIFNMINNQKQLVELFRDGYISEDMVVDNIDRIGANNLPKIIEFLPEKNQVQYLDRIDSKKRLEIIKEIYYSEAKFDALSFLENPEDIVSIIEHCENFPKYQDSYEHIIDIYVTKYNLNKEHLVKMVSNISLAILKVIENPNVVKIINSKPEEFAVIMELFNKENLEMNSASMNDILNSFLQRTFRLQHADILLTFPFIMNAIDSKNSESLSEKLVELAKSIDIEIEIAKYNWNLNTFKQELLAKNQNAIDCLHEITNKYVREERNKYLKEKLDSSLEKSTKVKYDKNELMKYFIANYSTEIIIDQFPKISADILEIPGYTKEEVEFIKNKDLIKKIIEYKKNPSQYGSIPEDIKSSMRYFNKVFEIDVASKYIGAFPDIDIDKKIYYYQSVDEDFMVNILMYLDMDKLRVDLLNNPDLIENLMKFWKQYKIGGWGNTFDDVLSETGVLVSPEIVANFIQYFGLSYSNLEDKVSKGELANISITALIDLAACYSAESNKYAMVFGNENFQYIASNPGPNSATMPKDKRIEKAVSLLHTIRNREYVTVPPMDTNINLQTGKSINVVVGNVSDITNLTLGERTGACMRIGGAGKSLFNFCLENENGFHIVFNNPVTGKFVTRVSGFRNGNTVFLNQLRNSKDSNFTNEDIVEACRKTAEELVELSKNSSVPIDNVVISSDYAMDNSQLRAQNTGIEEPQAGMKKFYTDVGTHAIILATSNENKEIVPFKPGNRNVPKYKAQRAKQRMLYNEAANEYLIHLQSLDYVLSGKNIDDLDIQTPENLVACMCGEDWCLIIDKDGTIQTYIMRNSANKELTNQEVKLALEYLKVNLVNEMTMASNMAIKM